MEYYTDLGKPNKVILLVVGAFRGGLRPLRKKNFLKLEKKDSGKNARCGGGVRP